MAGGSFRALRRATTIVALGATLALAGSANAAVASANAKFYVSVTGMQNLIETRGVSFTGFAHLNGYHVNVDIARCIGLRRYGVQLVKRRTLFYGFKCHVVTDNENRFTLQVFAKSSNRFYLEAASEDYSATAVCQNEIDYGGDWAVCLGKYRPHGG